MMQKALSLILLAASGPLLSAQQTYTISTIAGGAPPFTPATAASASIGQPQRVATDSGGNVYFSSDNSVFKMDAGGTLTLVAGNSRGGHSGDGGPAVAAQLNQPQGIAIDKSGNIYIADSANNRVRIVTPDGLINNFAGDGNAAYAGDNGPAVHAELYRPTGLAVDSSGNLYIADSGSFVVRKITTDGNIATFAGNNLRGFAGDGGSAVGAQLSEPEDVAVDSSGNVYIADTDNNSVRKVDSSGNITTVAGNQTSGFSGDNGSAVAAQLNRPVGVAVDSSGNLYISDYMNSRIRKVASGNISTVTGNGNFGFAGDGSSAAGAQLTNPLGIALDSSGSLYLADLWSYRIRKVSSGNISTVAGNGTVSYSGDGGPAAAAQLNLPAGVAVDGSRNLYIADTNNHRVRKVAPDGTISTVAGSGSPGNGAQLNGPHGVAVDSGGNLYIADTLNSRIVMIGTDGAATTIAGNGNPGYLGDGGAATGAQLNLPTGVAVDKSGNLYIADTANHRVRKISAGVISTVAGTGINGYGKDVDSAVDQPLFLPFGVAVDAGGNLYIADTGNNRVREVLAADGKIYSITGTGQATNLGDGGPAPFASVASPVSVAVDAAGNVFIASQGGGAIREVTVQGIITTLAGSSTAGYAGDGGPAGKALLNGAQGVAVDSTGKVYVADTGNNAVRLLSPTPFPGNIIPKDRIPATTPCGIRSPTQ
jgi:trimeric autotransporter adhesin